MSANQYRTAIVGVGKGGKGKAGVHSIGYAHADAYVIHPRTRLVAGCDLASENLDTFAGAYEVGDGFGFAQAPRPHQTRYREHLHVCGLPSGSF